MKAVELSKVSYRYPGMVEHALEGFDFSVGEGEFVLITGSSGSGKSTLCRLLNGLIPEFYGGEISGSVVVDGLETAYHSVNEMASHVGLVFQDPEDQIIMSTAESEIAFGLENKMLPVPEMRDRIAWACDRLGIGHLLDRKTFELSGGEKQKVVLASVMALKPRVLVLDEPSSQLDPISRIELFDLLSSLNGEGITVLLVEHNIDEVLERVDWVFDMDTRSRVEMKPSKPKTFKPSEPSGEVVVDVEGLCFSYGGRPALNGVNLKVHRGECLAITGRNGSGKTTLVKHFNGLHRPSSGSVRVFGLDAAEAGVEALASRVAYLPQNPGDMLFCDTVEEELKLTLDHQGVEGDVDGLLETFKISRYRDSYPRDLSVGERQRVALAAVMVADPELVVLDEPTRGIDVESSAALTSLIGGMVASAKTVIVVTQDMRLVSEVASREFNLGGWRR
ncbi:MAG: ATP-binding cassette domain-containing protein [Candidatus Altiarchaeales archaeon]|nr:ATP-binding cassette domain-containing protein [Candidatus Altiarchaeales archaeon]MBD3417174.1 ATP-binding cassette domain-containing protein [Candidatus Altiarchaeales archaeon]